MTRVCFDADEWYPVFTALTEESSWGYVDAYAVEVEPETLARWEKATEEFKRAQGEMDAAWKAAKP